MIRKVKEFPKPGKPIKKSNGKNILPNVEIFRKTFRPDVKKFYDDKWMIDNAERMNRLQKENFLHTIHRNHHPKDIPNPDDFVENYGFMRDVRILEKESTGEKRMFCDYDDFSDARIGELKDNQFPHRSVEIVNDEIKSLALLKSIPPYFKLPIVSPEYAEFQDREIEKIYFAEVDENRIQIIFSNFSKGENMPEDDVILDDEIVPEPEPEPKPEPEPESKPEPDDDTGDVSYQTLLDDIKSLIADAFDRFKLELKAEMSSTNSTPAQPANTPASPAPPAPLQMSEIQFNEQLRKASRGKEGKVIGSTYASRDTSELRHKMLKFAQEGNLTAMIDLACDSIPYTQDSDVPKELAIQFQEDMLSKTTPKELVGQPNIDEIMIEFNEPDNTTAQMYKDLYDDPDIARIQYYKERVKKVQTW